MTVNEMKHEAYAALDIFLRFAIIKIEKGTATSG